MSIPVRNKVTTIIKIFSIRIIGIESFVFLSTQKYKLEMT